MGGTSCHNERLNSKRRDLNTSHTLGSVGRNNSNPSNGSSGHAGGTRPGQTRKKPKDLSTREREGGSWVWGGWGCICCVYAIARSGSVGWVPV